MKKNFVYSANTSRGFTLAEVLITLAIIGIVAALTIPTLVQNYQERAWNTASQVFQRKLGEALKVMNVQGTLAGYTTTEAFVDELSKHIKITRICDNDDITTCFSDTVTWGDEEVDMSKIKKAKNFGQTDWDTNTVAVQFANGVNGVIAYNPSCTQNQFSNDVITIGENGIGTDCLAILYDVDGYKNPNTQNKDLRSINIENLAGITCAFELDGVCFSEPFMADEPMSFADCEAQKSALGIESCCPVSYCNDTDYWAAAVKKCGGVQNLPTQEQLTALANQIYDQPISGSSLDYEYANWDKDKASNMGFYIDSSNVFYVWSREENGPNSAFGRAYGYRETVRTPLDRNYNYRQVFCVAK